MKGCPIQKEEIEITKNNHTAFVYVLSEPNKSIVGGL